MNDTQNLHNSLKDNYNRFYIKLNPDSDRELDPILFHIHVDAHEELSKDAIDSLLELGLTYDLFDVDRNVYGQNGDIDKPFPHYAPLVHMTFATSSRSQYKKMWPAVEKIISKSAVKCYIEGEFIPVDLDLVTGAFNSEAYATYAPLAKNNNFSTFVSAIDGHLRFLPANVKLRRLDPNKNGRKDQFRLGEIHLTLREDTDRRVLELLCNLGFSAPFIPKLVESSDGQLETNNGELKIICDIPLTLQANSKSDLLRAANLAIAIIEDIGGVPNGSLKIEFATDFAVMNGIDYYKHIPPVISELKLRDDLVALDKDTIANTNKHFTSFVREARQISLSSTHQNRANIFKNILNNSMSPRHNLYCSKHAGRKNGAHRNS